MDFLSQAGAWIADNETVLSGAAAGIAIITVAATVIMRVFKASARSITNTATANQPEAPPISVAAEPARETTQQIQYCTTEDDYRIAWARIGEGYPLVRALGWFTHLGFEWESEFGRMFWERLARNQELIRYDGRGIGLSRADVGEFNQETRLRDLEAVVDAAQVDKFALIGLSEGGSTAIAYAAKHPERVSHLIIYGSFLQGLRVNKRWLMQDGRRWRALLTLVRDGWGQENASFRQMLTSIFMPDASSSQNQYFNEIQKVSADAETVAKYLACTSEVNVMKQAKAIQCPTLVLHRAGDLAIPLREGQRIASTIPNAKFVTLAGNNHWILLHEESDDAEIKIIEDFIAS